MVALTDAGPREVLDAPNHAVICTLNKNGAIHTAVVGVTIENGRVVVNSAVGRLWEMNLRRDPRITVLVCEEGNPFRYVEIRGTATATRVGADAHLGVLVDKYARWRASSPSVSPSNEERVKIMVTPEHVRYRSTDEDDAPIGSPRRQPVDGEDS